jgi:hypothetical protein
METVKVAHGPIERDGLGEVGGNDGVWKAFEALRSQDHGAVECGPVRWKRHRS